MHVGLKNQSWPSITMSFYGTIDCLLESLCVWAKLDLFLSPFLCFHTIINYLASQLLWMWFFCTAVATLHHRGIDALRVDYADLELSREPSWLDDGSTSTSTSRSSSTTPETTLEEERQNLKISVRCAFPFVSMDDFDTLSSEHCEIK